MERRQVLVSGLKSMMAICGLAGVSGSSSLNVAFGQGAGAGRAPQRARIIGEEKGDPDAPRETITVDRQSVERLYAAPVTKGVPKDEREVARKMLEIAIGYTQPPPPVSRLTKPDQVKQFLNLFGLGLKYSNGAYIPYCATGVAFCACKAYCEVGPQDRFDPQDPNKMFRRVLADINKYYFKPSPAVREMERDAKRRRTWIPLAKAAPSEIQPGWLVVFDWEGEGVPNHVGIVEKAESDALNTVEFNTSATSGGNQINGGAVSRKVRPYRYVMGYIKTY